MTRDEALKFLTETPYKFGHMVGFTKITPLNNKWILDMLFGKGDKTLQAHRSSYKTTCVSIALALLIILLPNERVLFMRKTDTDITDIIKQVKTILQNDVTRYFVFCLYGINLEITVSNQSSISTNLTNDPRGMAQLTAFGCGSSITGKHYDRIFTDDIVNLDDRRSRAERENTKAIYMELRNVINRGGGRIYNTGTPWHKDDAFSIMPPADRYDCYSTGFISAAELKEIKAGMTASLFAANYELKHIAADDVIFENPQLGYPAVMVRSGKGHIDAAYGGNDWTALTICQKHDGLYYVLGKIWHRHVDECKFEIAALSLEYDSSKSYCESNGDKGYLARDLRLMGMNISSYHEDMNKFIKITSYLKAAWKNIRFVEGTDPEYINQIIDYNENAEHDDAPDSLASIIRKQYFKKGENGVITAADETATDTAITPAAAVNSPQVQSKPPEIVKPPTRSNSAFSMFKQL